MRITSSSAYQSSDNFNSEPNKSVNSTDNKQSSTILNSNSQNTEAKKQPTALSDKYQQYSSLESNHFKLLLNTTLPSNKSQTPNQTNANIKSGEKPLNQPQNQSVSTAGAAKTEVGKSANNSSKSEYDINKIPGLKNSAHVTPEFLAKVDVIAKELDAEPSTILAIISYETQGTFSPSKKSPETKATGLIQFLPSTAKSLLTKELANPKLDVSDKKKVIDNLPVSEETKKELTKIITDIKDLPIKKEQVKAKIDSLSQKSKELNNELAKAKNLPKEQQEKLKSELKGVLTEKSQLITEKNLLSKEISRLPESLDNLITRDTAMNAFKQMSSVKQLDYVKKYLLPYKGKLNNPQDAYLSVLYPKAAGQGNNPNYVVFSEGSDAYAKNKHFDGVVDGKKDGIITVQEATKEVVDRLRVARLK